MIEQTLTTNDRVRSALAELAELRRWSGNAREFWPRYLAVLGQLSNASRAMMVLRESADDARWKKITEWSGDGASAKAAEAFYTSQIESSAERSLVEESCLLSSGEGGREAQSCYLLAVRQRIGADNRNCVAIVLLANATEELAREVMLRLSLVADTPEVSQMLTAAHQSRADAVRFASVLDVMTAFNAQKRFLAASITLCNEIATQFRCDRVSLGWVSGGYVRLKAMSRTEKFDRKMDAVQALESVMEEAVDQDEEVVFPPQPDSGLVWRDHEQFSSKHSVEHLCSIPLRDEDGPVGAITCERRSEAFTDAELQQLRLCADQAVSRLAELKKRDRWFGARLAGATREQLAKIIGPERTWLKALVLLIAACIVVLFLVPVPYRVEGNFVLRSEEVAHLTSPFSGFIEEAFVRPGDEVAKGITLLKLNTSDLELEETAAVADLHRFQRESEKARATKNLAEMRIAQAQAEQAQARLDLARYRLSQASLVAPFDAVVSEGDLTERLGAPVKQGEVLLRIERLSALYVEAEVNERDIHELEGKSEGQIAFLSQPKKKYPVTILAIEPAAQPKPEGNFFIVRCAIGGDAEPWWRPGMSGVCKLDIEKRSLFWIATHRTVDFLRMFFWW